MEHIYFMPEPQVSATAGDELDVLFTKPRDILRSKLEVLAATIFERLTLREKNLSSIGQDKNVMYSMIQSSRYWMTASERTTLYDQLLSLHKEHRDQDTDCWKDVVLVLRDFLTTWEAHEHAKMKTAMLSL